MNQVKRTGWRKSSPKRARNSLCSSNPHRFTIGGGQCDEVKTAAATADLSIIWGVSPQPMESDSPPTLHLVALTSLSRWTRRGQSPNATAGSPAIRNTSSATSCANPASRGCSRQALRDATLSSDFLNGKRFSMPWLSVPFQSAWSNGVRKGYGGYEWI